VSPPATSKQRDLLIAFSPAALLFAIWILGE